MWLSLWPLSVHSWLVSAYKYGKCPLLEGWLYQYEIVFNVKICLKLRKGREIINSVVKIIIAKDYFVLLPCMSLVDRSFSAVDDSLLLVYLIWLIAWLTILLLSLFRWFRRADQVKIFQVLCEKVINLRVGSKNCYIAVC